MALLMPLILGGEPRTNPEGDSRCQAPWESYAAHDGIVGTREGAAKIPVAAQRAVVEIRQVLERK